MSAVVNSVAYAGGRRVGEVAIADISEVLKLSDRFVWIGLHEPDASLLAEVQGEFGLHDLAIEDAARAHQRPKLERYGESLFVVLRTAHLDRESGGIDFGETHLFVGPAYVVSVRHGPSLPYVEVRSRCEASPPLLARGPGFVLYSLMDFVVDQYFPVLDAFEDKLEALEGEIFGKSFDRATTERIYQLKRDLLEVKRAIAPLVDMCNRLVRTDMTLIPEDVRPYFRDVYDHVIRINEMIDTLRELLTTALEANLSLISVSQNEAMKRLAGWAAIFAVPTMIAGVYGMNFKFMPELEWHLGYPLVMGLMLGACGFLYYKFKRSGWL
ncbi:MAG: magnesium and cobalt transport protein CorA [Candidatus Rokuibacteriota bacterium]|nr:MAG: magnesium and cobalt transport protein CorA [Candidatus Rokubacteria bacterium]